MDKARVWTDKKLSQMERKISDIYKEAQDGITQKWNAYMEKSGSAVADLQKAYDDAKKSGDKALIKSTGKKLQQAKTEQTIYSTSYKEMVEATTKQLANVNQTALAYMNGQIPSIYAKNYSQIGEDLKLIIPKFKGATEKSVLKIVNEDVVKKMITEGDIKMPNLKKRLSIPKDMRWNTKKINSSVLQGILQGDSMDKIAERLLPIMGNNEIASIRNARTLTTAAENSGRLDSYERLEEEGIIMKKVWIATADDRTRESHLAMDGQEVDIDEPFVDGDNNELMYPADPTAEPETVYNCRCSMRTHIVGFKKADGDIEKIDFERSESRHDREIQAEKENRK